MIGDDSQDLRGRLLDVRDELIVLKKSAVRGAPLQLGVFKSWGFALGSRRSRIRVAALVQATSLVFEAPLYRHRSTVVSRNVRTSDLCDGRDFRELLMIEWSHVIWHCVDHVAPALRCVLAIQAKPARNARSAAKADASSRASYAFRLDSALRHHFRIRKASPLRRRAPTPAT